MITEIQTIQRLRDAALPVVVASVWLVHGLYNKLLHGSPRHLAIVQSVPGLAGTAGEHALLGRRPVRGRGRMWVLWGRAAIACADVQTVVLFSMNVVELRVARPLLLWPAGLIPLNLGFLSLAWIAAVQRNAGSVTRVAAAASRRDRRAPGEQLDADLCDARRCARAVCAAGARARNLRGLRLHRGRLVEARSLRQPDCRECSVRTSFLRATACSRRVVSPNRQARPMRGLEFCARDTNCARWSPVAIC